MEWLHIINCTLAIIFCLLYSYQVFYIIYGCVTKPKVYEKTNQTNRYAVLIPARNEQSVIGQLVDSVKAQDYPSHLVDVYVTADNCTDKTFDIAKEHGAIVFERFNDKLKGKGYTMNFMIGKIFEQKGTDYYDGFFVFDADNLMDPNYITEMDKCFCAGNRIITSHRNSKNYDTNWITAGYSLWFLREAKLLNNVRSLLKTSCAVSGTGFMIHKDVLKRQNGWKHYLLTEDIEFTVDNVLQGEKISYCHDAIFYDEQPETFKASWDQRLRWSKGFLQVFRQYGGKMFKKVITKHDFSCYDMLMTISPAFITTLITVTVNLSALAYAMMILPEEVPYVLGEMLYTVGSIYITLFILGIVSGISEWEHIRCSLYKKIKSFFTFPLFMLTYVPISITALFTKVQWKEIEHKVSTTIDLIDKTK